MEGKTQQKLVRYLRSKGCYVIKTKPPLAPVGCPDILALYEGWWGAFEIKSSMAAPFGPLQRETIEKLNDWSTCWRVYPENVDDVIAQLETIL